MSSLSTRYDLIQDQSAKSLSFFCKEDVVLIDREWIDWLIEASVQHGNSNARICLHTSPEANFHEMIILERKGRYFRPHKHLEKGESWHIIEGEVAVFIFNNKGEIIQSCTLSHNRHFIGRVGINQCHTLIPLTEYTIYHEAKPGPYLGVSDSVYPDWAPDGSVDTDAQVYMKNLLGQLLIGL